MNGTNKGKTVVFYTGLGHSAIMFKPIITALESKGALAKDDTLIIVDLYGNQASEDETREQLKDYPNLQIISTKITKDVDGNKKITLNKKPPKGAIGIAYSAGGPAMVDTLPEPQAIVFIASFASYAEEGRSPYLSNQLIALTEIWY